MNAYRIEHLLLYLKYFSISVFLHSIIIACYLLHSSVQKIDIGSTRSETYVNSYTSSIKQYESPQTDAPHPKLKLVAKIKMHKLGLVLQRKNVIDTSQKISAPSKTNRGENIEKILALLHTAIKEKQFYPKEALYLEKEGRVTLGFILLPDGTIQNLYVKKTSGTSSLDNAALLAASRASPLKKAQFYLKVPQEYFIDIIFQLTV